MLKRFMLIAFICAAYLTAGAAECELSGWYISKGNSVTDWVGSYEQAKKNKKNFYFEKKWEFNREKGFYNNADLFAVATLKADEDYDQGFSFKGNAQVRLNGEVLKKISRHGNIYRLSLKKGDNVLEMKLPKLEKGGRNHILFTRVNLEYLYPSVEKRMEDLTLAVKYLKKNNPNYPAGKILSAIKAVPNSDNPSKAIADLQYKALLLENPEIKFDKIVYRETWSGQFPPNWQGNSAYTRGGGREFNPTYGRNTICIYDFKTKTDKVIYQPKDDHEAALDLCLSFDAKKILFTGSNLKNKSQEVCEINIDGTGKRQITPSLPEIDNYNPIYLPNGKILFNSTASLNSVPCVGGSDYVGTLYEINYDGTKMRQVAFDQENDWYPWVKENGRVMYSRWEYTDNSHYFTRILLEMNPDGTNNRSIYGSNSFWPNTMFYAKQIPGKISQFSAIVSGHHGVSRAGELLVFDQNKGDFEADGVVRRIPGRNDKVKPAIIDQYMAAKYPLFLHPYPISEAFFLVSAQLNPDEPWSLYLVDKFDNMVKIKTAKQNRRAYEPIPLMARKVPPVIPDRRRLDAKDAVLYIQDVYAGPGLRGIPKGKVKELRLFTYGYAYRLTGNHDALAIEGGWDTKRVLGTVKVEKDGSVMVRIPHSMPISIQPIDENGSALQIMKSWTAAQPGEMLSCVGCHESPNTPPLTRPTLASRRAPKKLTPWSKHKGKLYAFSFKREVQPVLDKYCIGCHDGSNKEIPNFKDCSERRFNQNAHFGKSYMALHPFVRRPGPESNLHLFNPMEWHASTSELFQKLEKGHHGVEIADEDMRQLRTWADLNVPYHGSWLEVRNDKTTCDFAKRTVEYKKKFAGIDDDIEWMPPVPPRGKFITPKSLPPRPEKVTTAGWPKNLAGNQIVERSVVVDGKKLSFVKVPAGKYVIGSVKGERDEFPMTVVTIDKPFLMSTTEVTNGMYALFDPKHSSEYIDQQWKDHIYPGYAANLPEQPVIRISWQESLAFCKWLSGKLDAKVTLPTEGQWEWAARGGSDQPFFFGTAGGFEFYSNLADVKMHELAVMGVDPQPVSPGARNPLTDFVPKDDSFNDQQLTPQGTAMFDANQFGLYDMIGNVCEWTRSSYKPYPYSEEDGRNDVSDIKSKKVARGGSWRDRPKFAKVSHRWDYESYQRVYNVGIRPIIEFSSEAELDSFFNKMKLEKKYTWKKRLIPIKVSTKNAKISANMPDSNPAEGLSKLIDGTVATKFYSSSYKAPSHFIVSFPKATSIAGYVFVSGNDCPERDPKAWKVYGSNNGSDWVLIDAKTEQYFDKRVAPYKYQLKESATYKDYKFVIEQNNGNGLQISELKFWKEI
jgi:formylglycine-generating enzyme required for sulfatase activity